MHAVDVAQVQVYDYACPVVTNEGSYLHEREQPGSEDKWCDCVDEHHFEKLQRARQVFSQLIGPAHQTTDMAETCRQTAFKSTGRKDIWHTNKCRMLIYKHTLG
jgi:hypothetical protein